MVENRKEKKKIRNTFGCFSSVCIRLTHAAPKPIHRALGDHLGSDFPREEHVFSHHFPPVQSPSLGSAGSPGEPEGEQRKTRLWLSPPLTAPAAATFLCVLRIPLLPEAIKTSATAELFIFGTPLSSPDPTANSGLGK